MKSLFCSKNIILQLREAISKLEAYVSQGNETSIVSRSIASMHSLLASHMGLTLKEGKLERYCTNDEISYAVEFILRHRIFFEKLKQGTPEERELAQSFAQTIEAYNQSRDVRIHKKSTGIISFIPKTKVFQNNIPPKVTLPRDITIRKCYPEITAPETIRQTLSNTVKASATVFLPKQSIELFQMKVLSLLGHYRIASNSEARDHVKQSPISASEKDALTCTLTQTLELFPWQTVVVTGDSALDPKTRSIGKLFPETFRLTLESTQTGFPHPSQRVGWTLANELLPEHPQRVDLLGFAAELFRRRACAVENLLSQGSFLKSAKSLLFQKTKLFQAHRNELVSLHQQLALTILRAAPQELVPLGSETIIARFYEVMLTHPTPYDWLSGMHQTLRNFFIVKPHRTLLEAIVKGKATDFGSRQPKDRFLASQHLLNEAVDEAHKAPCQQGKATKLLNEKIKLDYIGCFGPIFGNASKNIILQYLSEDLIFDPPQLTLFESKVQTAAYQHLNDFLDEIETPPTEMLSLMRSKILADIATFECYEPSAISKELSFYFQNRYSSLIT